MDAADPYRVSNEQLQTAIGMERERVRGREDDVYTGTAASCLPDGYADLQREKIHPKVERERKRERERERERPRERERERARFVLLCEHCVYALCVCIYIFVGDVILLSSLR